MKIPCCSVCQTRYNEEERVPLLLQCGHGFCKECLSRMFSSSSDANLTCPRCRHVSTVGNSVQALRKNYAVLSLILSAADSAAAAGGGGGGDCDFTDDDEDRDDSEVDDGDDQKLDCRKYVLNNNHHISIHLPMHTYYNFCYLRNSFLF